MKGQSTSWRARVKEEDRQLGIENGLIWMEQIEDLGEDYRAIAQLHRAPIGSEFIGRIGDDEPEERQQIAAAERGRFQSAHDRHSDATKRVFCDYAKVQLEKLEATLEPEMRANILLNVLQRSLDVAHAYVEKGWEALDANPEALRAELKKLASESDTISRSGLLQVGIVLT